MPTLLHSPADLVRQALVDLGLGALPPSTPWPVFVASEPASPDDVCTIYDTQGTDDGRSMIDGEVWGHNGFQVRVRSVDHTMGWVKADEIWTALCKSILDRTVTLDGQAYLIHCCAQIRDVIPLGKEVGVSKRSLFTVNALLAVRML